MKLTHANKIHRKATAAEHAYNCLSIDMPNLSIAVLAIDAAEMRGKIISEIEQFHLDSGEEIPPTDPEFHISQEILDGSESSPGLPLKTHLEACYKADTELARAIRNVTGFQHHVKHLHASFIEIDNACRSRFGNRSAA